MKYNMKRYDEYRKQYYDKNRKPAKEYKRGEEVMVDFNQGVSGNKKKLDINRRRGIVVDKLNDNSYMIKYKDSDKLEGVNIKRIFKLNNNQDTVLVSIV